MKHRLVEAIPRSVRDAELLLRDPKLAGAVADLVAFLRGEAAEPRFFGFAEDELTAIHRLAHQKSGAPFDEREFVRQMAATRPRAVQPSITDPAVDLWFMLSQREILEHLWPALDPRSGTRGPDPGFAAKAFLFFAASRGLSAHLDDNHHSFLGDSRSRAVFEWIEASAAAATGAKPRQFQPTTYAQTLRQMHKTAERFEMRMGIETNIELVKQAHAILGVEKVQLGIDGMLWQAWVEQVGKRPEREAQIRRVARSATPIAIGTGDGFVDFVRGYRFVALVDLTTGLPLVWTLWPGHMDEARALQHLLYLLYDLWPDIPAEAIVADAAWDEKWAGELCLVHYGLIPVAPRKPSQLEVEYPLTRFASEAIAKFRGDGTLFCRRHGCPMVRNGYEVARRDLGDEALDPGDPANPAAFRVRATCPVGGNTCGRPGLPIQFHWSALSPYPHSLAAGHPARHARRLALYARRNANEALHSAIQVGNKLGLRGAARQRTAKEPTVEAMLSIGLLMRSAFMLADLRVERDLFPAQPPPDLARLLGL